MNHINIFTQSTIKCPQSHKGKIIYVMESVYKGEPFVKSWIHDVEMTKNEASLETVLLAARKITNPAEVIIWTDNPYIEMNIDRAKEWRENGYLNEKGEKRKYWEKWDEILRILEKGSYRVTTGLNAYSNWMISELKKG